MTKEIEIVKPESIEAQIAAWSATDATLKAAVEATKGITVAGHAEGPKKGRQAVHDALMILVNHRTPIEARRVELKARPLELGRLVDSEAKRLTEILLPRETELRADRDAYDVEQKRIKDEAERLERERLEAEAKAKREAEEAEAERVRAEAFAKLTDRTNRVTAAGGAPDLVWLTTAGDDEVDSLISRLEREKLEREAAEAAARIEREKEEAAAREVAAANARREAEEKAIRDAAEAKARAEQAKRDEAERERQAEIAEQNRIEAQRLADEREAFEKSQREAREAQERIDAERRRMEEEEQAKRDAEAEAERTKQAQAEADAIKAAQAPDREKIAAWATKALSEIDHIGAPLIADAELAEYMDRLLGSMRHRLTSAIEAMQA